MTLPVVLSNRAKEDLFRNTNWWAKHHSVAQAERWYDGFIDALETLAEHPERCPLAREHRVIPFEPREFHYGVSSRPTHRALFTIRPDMVFVLCIRRASQADLTEDDLP